MIWQSRPQNHALRHRPQRNSLDPLLPHPSHVVDAIAGATGSSSAQRLQIRRAKNLL